MVLAEFKLQLPIRLMTYYWRSMGRVTVTAASPPDQRVTYSIDEMLAGKKTRKWNSPCG